MRGENGSVVLIEIERSIISSQAQPFDVLLQASHCADRITPPLVGPLSASGTIPGQYPVHGKYRLR
jgi:hypothetical protein